MALPLDIRPLQPDEIEMFDRVVGAALHFSPGGMVQWIERLGVEHFRVVCVQGRIVAGLGLIWMGQWFGGVGVPMVGLSAVGVAPDQRGSGIGAALLQRVLEEIYAAGFPLSALYPATLPFYHRAGYERAGQRITYELPLAAIDVRDFTLALVPAGDDEQESFVQTYQQRARRTAGNLERPAWMWQRKVDAPDLHLFRYLVLRGNQVEGYVIFTQDGRDAPLVVRDVCVLTPGAGRRILTLFAGYRSTVEHVVWQGGLLDPLVYLLREPLVAGMRPRCRSMQVLDWLLRLVDVAKALNIRGYPPGMSAQLHFEVHDSVLAANNGRFILEVANGQGQVSLGGQGRIRLGVRELAALYSGFIAPAELRVIGAIDAAEPDLALAGAVFATAHPWMPDMF